MDFPGFSVRPGFVSGGNGGNTSYPISKDVKPVYKIDSRQERPYERSQYGGRTRSLFVAHEDTALASARSSVDKTILYNSRAQRIVVPQDQNSYSWAA